MYRTLVAFIILLIVCSCITIDMSKCHSKAIGVLINNNYTLKNINIKVVYSDTKVKGGRHLGFYDRYNDTIYIWKYSQDWLGVHEWLHAYGLNEKQITELGY